MHEAAGRVSRTAAAFAHREQQYDFAIYSMWPDPSDTEKEVTWSRK